MGLVSAGRRNGAGQSVVGAGVLGAPVAGTVDPTSAPAPAAPSWVRAHPRRVNDKRTAPRRRVETDVAVRQGDVGKRSSRAPCIAGPGPDAAGHDWSQTLHDATAVWAGPSRCHGPQTDVGSRFGVENAQVCKYSPLRWGHARATLGGASSIDWHGDCPLRHRNPEAEDSRHHHQCATGAGGQT